MDPVSITVAALLAKTLDQFAGEAGKGAWSGIGRLVGLIRSHFADDNAAEAALAQVEATPASPEGAENLAQALDRHAAEDPAFREALRAYIREAQQDPATASFVTEISGNAQVGKLVNIDRVDGDVSF
jgi:hypothetical protein